MVDNFDHPIESDPETAFLETAVRYLDNQLSNDEAGNFLNDLGATPQRCALFVTLCIQSQVLVEKLSAKSASDALLGLDPNAALHGVAFRDWLDLDDAAHWVADGVMEPTEPFPNEAIPPRRAAAVVIDPRDLPTLADLAAFPRTGRSQRPTQPEGTFSSEEDDADRRANRQKWNLAMLRPRGVVRSAAAILLPLLLAFGAFELLPGNHAVLTQAVGAQWDAPNASLVPGDKLSTKPLFLKAGVAQITFQDGVTMIVEGPARFQIRSQSLTELFAGKLAASVTPAGHGFTVQTDSARVVDLGTEFGVSVSDDGATHVDVFKGNVEAMPQSAGVDAGPGKILAVGDSARVSSTAVITDPVGALPQHYVRSMQTTASELDLADLVAGGDGTTNRRNVAIDLRNGNVGPLPPMGTCAIEPVGAYMPVPSLPAVNGVFIPCDTTQVDSAGHQFPFPPTSGNTFNHLWAGGHVPSTKESSPPFTPPFIPALDGVHYDAAPHGFLFLHANKGITFDLAAIRRLHPGCTIGSFHAVAGNISKVPNAKADAWVLVDGEARFSREQFTTNDGAIAIDVPIYDSDRFLTLAVTDGGDGFNYDWIILGDPKLELSGGAVK